MIHGLRHFLSSSFSALITALRGTRFMRYEKYLIYGVLMMMMMMMTMHIHTTISLFMILCLFSFTQFLLFRVNI